MLEAAPLLLGAVVRSYVDGETVAVKLDEVEAYGGSEDPASHAYRGMTARNKPMFGRPGTLYVYRSYGIHWCLNVSSGPEGSPAAILLRGGTVVEGAAIAAQRRRRSTNLADGPGKLCQALGVTGTHTGTMPDATEIEFEMPPAPVSHDATPRIGITRAVDRAWRFTTSESGET